MKTSQNSGHSVDRGDHHPSQHGVRERLVSAALKALRLTILVTTAVAAALTLATSKAHASDFSCVPVQNADWNGAKHEFVPTKMNQNVASAVRETHVTLNNGVFTTRHVLNNGRNIYRGDQYMLSGGSGGKEIADAISLNVAKTGTIYGKWTAVRGDKPDLQMTRFIGVFNGQLLHVEFLNKDGTPVNRFAYSCALNQEAQPTETAKAPETSGVKRIPLYSYEGRDDALFVNVTLGSTAVQMQLDTGAYELSVNPATADDLVARGEASWLRSETANGPDGKEITSKQINIYTVTIGSVTISDVKAGVLNGMPLFGLNALKKLGRFTVDASAHELTFD